jgi:septin family protein
MIVFIKKSLVKTKPFHVRVTVFDKPFFSNNADQCRAMEVAISNVLQEQFTDGANGTF